MGNRSAMEKHTRPHSLWWKFRRCAQCDSNQLDQSHGVERLERRVSEWRSRSTELNGDLLQLFYEKFFRAFGFGLNGELFEQVAARFSFEVHCA